MAPAIDAVVVLVLSAGVVALLARTDPQDGLVYLLAFPIWIVAKDLGVLAGMVAGATALLFVVLGTEHGAVLGPPGYVGCAAIFFGTGVAGAWAAHEHGQGVADRPAPALPVLTLRPEVAGMADALSRRELQVLEMIATGANNAEIAERFVISLNTVKSHVSRILHKLGATNRTEAAFRYLELYGAPSVDRITAASATNATVSSLAGGDEVVLHLQDGRDLDLPLLQEVSGHLDVGNSAIVYFDHYGRPIGWFVPDEGVGVDLRRWTP